VKFPGYLGLLVEGCKEYLRNSEITFYVCGSCGMKEDVILGEMEKNFGRVLAACLYGSQVCGYATEDSDFDALVVLEEYDPGVKYTYVDNGIEIAFLAVSRKVIEEDAKESAYGGFITDRLINPLNPLVNEAYLRELEVERKKTVVKWETTKLVLKKKEDSKYIDINILFYPFKKWNKISSIYRPYLYSIENTLRSDLKEQNLRALLPGFQAAIKQLMFLKKVYPGWYRIQEEFVDQTLEHHLSTELERIKIVEREMEDVVSRYLTHSRAGDSDRDLIIKEVLSKVKREVRHIREKGFKSPLEDPEKFLIYPK
jgi:predicted nucleotidyltransferase